MTIFDSFLLILAFATVAISLDLSLKGDPCARFDTCYTNSPLRTCTCDDDCYMYGTCCQDAIKVQSHHSTNEFQCYHKRTKTPVFVKRSCLENFRGHPDTIKDCFDDDLDDMDVKNTLLVTSRRTKTTYWSSKCATCNNEIDDDLEFWTTEVFCPRKAKVDRNLIRRNLTFDEDTKQWGLLINGEFLHCVIKYIPPPFAVEVKQCTPNLISSCPTDYSHEDIVKKCSMYYGERKLKSADVYYKNIHCAICNGVNVKELECPGMTKPEDTAEETDFREIVEEVFIRGQWLEKEKGQRFKCSKGFSYDPLWKRCRRYVEPMLPMSTFNRNFSPVFGKDYFLLWAALLVFLL